MHVTHNRRICHSISQRLAKNQSLTLQSCVLSAFNASFEHAKDSVLTTDFGLIPNLHVSSEEHSVLFCSMQDI